MPKSITGFEVPICILHVHIYTDDKYRIFPELSVNSHWRSKGSEFGTFIEWHEVIDLITSPWQ